MSGQLTSKTKPFKGKIENWTVIKAVDPDPAYQGLGFVIFGNPSGHPEITNWIRTSMVVKVQDEELPWFVETLNSLYELGAPDNRYEHYYGVNKPID